MRHIDKTPPQPSPRHRGGCRQAGGVSVAFLIGISHQIAQGKNLPFCLCAPVLESDHVNENDH